MPRTISSETWLQYIDLRRKRGFSLPEAIKVVGIGFDTAKRFEAGEGTSGAHLHHLWLAQGLEEGGLGNAPIALEGLTEPARRGLTDFGFFGERFYGVKLSPWQDEANAAFDEMYRKDDDRRYIVMNMPPESGKTSFMERKCAQMTARDRAIRGLIGSYANNMASRMMVALANSLDRRNPWEATEMALRGGAFDAESTLWADYGRFRPEDAKRWNQREIVVLQQNGQVLAGKESTWIGYGRESRENLGSRFDFIVWDDLVTAASMGKTVEAYNDLLHWWDTEGETRLNMGGLLVLLGQRISGTDLYRHALDKMGFEEGEDLDFTPTGKKYVHLCYQAHYEDQCVKDAEGKPVNHKPSSPAWRPDGTGGCILEPRRVGWKHQVPIMLNNPNHYATQYQQRDGDPRSVLIPKLWIDGGHDPETNETFFGCWDNTRGMWELPEGLHKNAFGIITVDPSPTMYWAIQAWVYVPDETAVKSVVGKGTGMRYLVDVENRKMGAPDFLEYHPTTQVYTGLLHDWYQEFEDLGVPLRYVVFEEAAAQRWALQYEIVTLWYRRRQVQLIPHKTHGWNKPDEKMGVTMLKTPYRQGLVNLPRQSWQNPKLQEMIRQLTSWSENYGGETDQVMANWFLESNLWHMVRTPAPEDDAPRGQTASGLFLPMNAKSLLSR